MMDKVAYQEGYTQAIRDLAGFINDPTRPLVRKLCTPKGISVVLGFIHENAEEFMKSPTPESFDLEFEIVGKRVRVWRG